MIYFFNYALGPYHYPRYKEVEKLLPGRIAFVELASRIDIYPWTTMTPEFNKITLFPGESFETINSKDLARRISQFLDKRKPEVVISTSYATAPMRQVTTWAKKNNAVSIGFSDSWKGDKTRYLPFELLKGGWCRIFYDGMFLSGSRSLEYYSGIGFPQSRTWLGYNAVDNDYYSSQASNVRRSAHQYRIKYKLPAKYFLCASRLSPEKNIERLLMAYAMYHKAQGAWDLVLAGSGPLEAELRSLAKSLEIDSKVHFVGWRQIDQMPIFYGLASCFILPSISEPWGIVVNEAMASGLPILVSEKCGCLPDLCVRGLNGLQFNPFNLSEMVECMLRISSGACDLHEMGKKSHEIIKEFSPQKFALSLRDEIEVLSTKKSKL